MSAPEYLVQYGRGALLGRFRSGLPFHRGDEAVIRSTRGLELGVVLCSASATAQWPDPHVGEIERPINGHDHETLRQARMQAQEIAAAAGDWAHRNALPLLIVDAEEFLDGKSVVLHAIATGPCDASPMLDDLAEQFGLIVRLYDLNDADPLPADAPDHEEPLTCGKENCGQGECSDCGDGGHGCNSCSAGSAQELNNYFAQLRAEMENGRLPLA